MKRHNFLVATAAVLVLAGSYTLAHAAPYASGIVVSGTTVNYVMNQDSDTLEISVNGGAFAPAGDGTAKGAHTFTIPSGATFSIRANKTESGFTTPDGGTLAENGGGPAYVTNTFNGDLMSDLNGALNQFNAPRGIAVSQDPNASNFGTVYISNANAAAVNGRTLTGRGIYALKADQTDAGFQPGGDVNAAAQSALFGTSSTNSPYKLTVGKGGDLFVSGFGDALSGVWRMPANLSSNTQLLNGTTGFGTPINTTCDGTTNTGTGCLPAGQNHGSVLAAVVTGSIAGGDLVLYTADEDMNTAQLTRVNNTDPKTNDTNKIWKYNIGANATPYAAMPTVVTSPLIPSFSIGLDMEQGKDGKFYISENRAQPANSTGLFVTDANGVVLFDSQKETAKQLKTVSTAASDYNHDGTVNAADYVMWRKQSGTAGPDADGNGDSTVDGADYTRWRSGNASTVAADLESGFGDIVNDAYSNIQALAVSPDQKWLATWHTNNIVMVTPLINGIPDIANRLALNVINLVGNARDIAFDAADNLHLVSSGLGKYIVLGPGGNTVATTSWNGSSYAFNLTTTPGSGSVGGGAVPEPGTLVLALSGILAFGCGRRRH